jgi:hypothetical protein
VAVLPAVGNPEGRCRMRSAIVSASLFGFMLALSLVPSAPLSGAPQGGKKGTKNKKAGEKAHDGVIENWGRPKNFDEAKGKVNSYWLWYDDGIWHLRTTGGGKGAHHFQGRIDVAGGRLVNLKGQKGEYGGRNVDRYVFSRDLTAIVFDFKTDEGVDGLNFMVGPATATLKFTLAYDGKAEPEHIRVGKNGDRPAKAVFTAPGHPPDPPTPKKK